MPIWRTIDASSAGAVPDKCVKDSGPCPRKHATGMPMREATSLSTKASVDYKVSVADTLQVAYAKYGKRITPQGSFEPTGAVNLGFRHTVSTQLSAVLTVTDVFNTQAWRRYTNTTTLAETYERRPLGRLFFVGFVYQVGQGSKKPKRDGGFEYDNGGGS